MEIKFASDGCFHVGLGKTEMGFVNELAVAGDCKPEKVIADLTFLAIVNAHAQMRIDEMMRTHDDYWDR